jgi:hypothetical protein
LRGHGVLCFAKKKGRQAESVFVLPMETWYSEGEFTFFGMVGG